MSVLLRLLSGRQRLAPYLGQVATHTFSPSLLNAAFKQMMTRTQHVCKVDVSSVQLVYASWQGAEVTIGANGLITSAIEFPVGTFTQVKFSGSATGTITDGSYLVSDPVSVSIPAGATFFSRSYYTNTVGICYNALGSNAAAGEGATYGASGVVDQTMGGAIVPTAAGPGHCPIAIIGQTTQPAFSLLGDSRCAGVNDAFTGTSSEIGEIARSIGSSYACMNLGIGGATAQTVAVAGSAAKRIQLSAYASHVICQFGTNDLVASRTAVQLAGDVATIRGLLPNKKFYVCTVAARTTSTDAWATTANQTVLASEAQRLSYNDSVRNTPIGAAGYLEIADQVESARGSGFWKAPGYTTDGVHESQTAYTAIQTSGAIDPSWLTR